MNEFPQKMTVTKVKQKKGVLRALRGLIIVISFPYLSSLTAGD